MYTLHTDHSLHLIVKEGTSLVLRPFGLAYGVRLDPLGATTDGDHVIWTLPNDLSIELNIESRAHGLGLMFHGKPPLSQIGVELPLADAGPWYGMGERVIQGWPLEQTGAISQPFIPYDHAPDGTLNIGTPLWIGAAGVALLVEHDTGRLDATLDADPHGMLRVVQHAPPVSFGAGLDGAFERPTARLPLRFLLGSDVQNVTQRAIEILGHPTSAPPLEMLAQPIWTTWARYKMAIDQAQTLTFAHEIVQHKFGRSVLEIDDRWQTDYGDLAFDQTKFPNPKAMVDELHTLGFRVTLWVPPFFAPHSATFQEAAALGFLVRHPANDAPYFTRWWQGWGGLLDVSNPAALAWWHEKLTYLQIAYGIDGFKFDGAEGNFLPAEAVTHAPTTPAEYADRYVAFVAAHWAWTEVRTGWRSQQHGILFREWDKSSHWGLDNGLHAVITQALTMSVIGYPFILPDMIGGNAYAGEMPDRELLIRWTQTTALLPAMQFSIAPWQYDDETSAICRRYAQLHADLAPYLAELCAETCADGTPLVRPLWWHFPDDAATWRINDQWLLGPRWLVAPVLEPGARSRAIYLPAGEWRDHWTGDIHSGPLTLPNHPAPLEILPLFERIVEQ